MANGLQRYREMRNFRLTPEPRGKKVVARKEGLRFSGLTVFGFLLPYMGNNEVLGWAYTDNMADRGDIYAEVFDDCVASKRSSLKTLLPMVRVLRTRSESVAVSTE